MNMQVQGFLPLDFRGGVEPDRRNGFACISFRLFHVLYNILHIEMNQWGKREETNFCILDFCGCFL